MVTLMTENVTGCHAARNKCQVVMIVGPAGAGKFTLANKILDRPDYDLFEERQDGAGVTTKIKEGTWDDLVVIDTPGVPSANVDPQTTVSYFDSIVEYVRKERMLSTLVFLVHQDDGIEPSSNMLGNCRILLEQFNNFPCSKLIVCRQPELEGKSRSAGGNRNKSGKLVEQIPYARAIPTLDDGAAFRTFLRGQALEDSGLSMPLVLLTDGYTEESSQQVLEIVSFIRRSEHTEIDVPFFRTSCEMRNFLAALADPKTRRDALKLETQELEASLWSRNIWMATHVVPLAYVSATAAGSGFLWTGPFIKREQEEGTRIRIKIKLKETEMEKGTVDDEQLGLAKERLNSLDTLLGN